MKRKPIEWCHVDSKGHRTGDMMCDKCGDSITDGNDYRYYFDYKINGFVNEHRHCSEDDPHWREIDILRAFRIERIKKFQEACKQFSKEWGVDYEALIQLR